MPGSTDQGLPREDLIRNPHEAIEERRGQPTDRLEVPADVLEIRDGMSVEVHG